MSLHDYEEALLVSKRLRPFASLIMSAWLRGSEPQRERLAKAFPAVVDELQKRLRSPGGVLPSERDFEAFEAPRAR